jgi:sulfur relay (sulfurtransferase) DsrC/TusE family protein
MKKRKTSPVIVKKSFRNYSKSASSFWSAAEFDTTFGGGSNLDFTKLAATQRAIGNFVNIVTGKQIPVVFQNNDSSYTDGERVVIGTKLDGANFDPAVGLALHEGSHIAYTDFRMFKGATKLSNSPFSRYIASQLGVDDSINLTDAHYNTIKQLLNWIEDRRIDYKIYTIAPGYRMYYEAMYDKYFNDKIIDRALATEEKSEETWDDYMFHVINFTNPNRKLHTLSKLQQIWDLIDLKNINRLQNTYEALDVAIEVFQSMRSACRIKELEDINDMFNENDLGKPNSDDSSNTENPQGSGSDGDSDDSDSDDSDSDANTESDESQSETSGQSNKSKMSASDQAKLEKAIRQQQDFIDGTQKKTGRLNKVQSKLVAAMRESGTETRVVKTGADGGTMGDITTVVIKKLSKDVICAMPGLFAGGAVDHINNVTNTSKFAADRINNMNNVVTTGIILGKQLGNKLQLRNADRTLKTTRLETGKIDRRLVAQLGYDNVNVFHRIVTDKFKNYFIHISIDASGSMSGDRIEQAIKSAVAIAQAASMTTGIRVQISLRGTDNMQGNTERCVTVYAYDSATDKISKIRNIFKYLNVFGCTPEGIAFKSIEKDLKADAKGDELIFINYSDGSPSNVAGVARSYNGVEYTRKIINDLRSMNMNIISYFISDGSSYDSEKTAFKRMYGVDAQFINPVNMTDVSKTMNTKFLEIAK